MDKLISQQAALDTLCNECPRVQSVCPHYPCREYLKIEKLPSVQEQQWIPVTEKLPKQDTDVLITDINGNVDIAWLSTIWTEEGEELWWFTGDLYVIEVKAWMPRPKPYKETQ